jgi:hypothetical protein
LDGSIKEYRMDRTNSMDGERRKPHGESNLRDTNMTGVTALTL